MPHKPTAKARMTVAELAAAMKRRNWLDRYTAIDRYSKQMPTADAIPVLRAALSDEYHATVKSAADALRKLGPAAIDAVDDLMAAAARVDSPSGMPQSYPQCVAALVAIQPDHPMLTTLIKQFVGLDNWVPLGASLRALKAIGTPEALDLLRRMATFWEPELNKMQKRVVEQLLRT